MAAGPPAFPPFYMFQYPIRSGHALAAAPVKTMQAKHFLLTLLLGCSALLLSPSQARAQVAMPSLDSVDMLISNVTLQLEVNTGIDAMYNFDFRTAQEQYLWLRHLYPRHPLPYFLRGLTEWWKIMPNIQEQRYDATFHSYMDSTISMAERLYDDNEDKKNGKFYEAAFFLAGAHAFKGRLYGERGQWTKATFSCKRAMSYFNDTKGKSEEGWSDELYFGDGLYNYFIEWIKENYKALRPVLWFFNDGDKRKGLEQLEHTANNAFYTRMEAITYLIRIYGAEGQPQKALLMAQSMYKKYPNNPYFHRLYARALYNLGKFREMGEVSERLLANTEQGATGYEDFSGRYGAYFLGVYYKSYLHDAEKAKEYFKKAIVYSQRLKDLQSGYSIFSMRELAKLYQAENDLPQAKHFYDAILKYADKKSTAYVEAKKFEKEYEKLQKKQKRQARKRA